jgi:hypothetical protein
VPGARAVKDNMVRVIDESGEDYLFARFPVRTRDRFVERFSRFAPAQR